MPNSFALSGRGNVWVLEDSAAAAELACQALSGAHDVEFFTDGAFMLQRASSGDLPDVIVLDGTLPNVRGVEVCRALREGNDAISLPILVLTTSGDKLDVVDALSAGANDYVSKPYDVAEVIARVSSLVRTSHLHHSQVSRARELSLAAAVGAALTMGRDLTEIASSTAQALFVHLDALTVEIWSTDCGQIALLARAGIQNLVPSALIHSVATCPEPLVGSAPEPLGAENAVTGAITALPLLFRSETLGVLVVVTRGPLGDSRSILTTVGDLLALGVARARTDDDCAALLVRERNTRAEAEAANRSKDDFIAMVSHELRTPLNAITGWAALLLGDRLDEAKSKRGLEVIQRSARSQAQLIDDLLDISSIVSGSLRINVSNVDVASVAEIAIESVRFAADKQGVTLHASIDKAAGQVSGDADRIQQIVWNLLTNAIKFTPRGGTVRLDLTRVQRGIVIDVTDSGRGIDASFLPHVFERFKQGDLTKSAVRGGLGLGLAIVRHLVELHCGTIEATSEGLGHGARFRVVLGTTGSVPPRQTLLTRVPSGLRRAYPPGLTGQRVLAVDDSEDARELIRVLLEACNMCVQTASSASEAFEIFARGGIDLILCDIAMPLEDGLSFITRVRARSVEDGGSTPAVALSAYARLEDRTRALRAGFDSHIAKPVESAELLAVLATLANR
jgi:signal transduction histidine kinase/AmiR/NasT family two-component response regulator